MKNQEPTEEQRELMYQRWRETGNVSTVSDQFGFTRATVHKYKTQDKWEERKQAEIDEEAELREKMNMILDPDTDENKLATFNRRTIFQIQALYLEEIKQRIMNGERVEGIVNAIQKLSSSNEKLTSTMLKTQSGGVEKSQNVQLNIDMDKVLDTILKAREKGIELSMEEAMNIMEAEYKKLNG